MQQRGEESFVEGRGAEEAGEGFKREVARNLENEFVWKREQRTVREAVEKWCKEDAQEMAGQEET